MKPRIPLNPFVIGHPAEADHFADREHELNRVVQALRDPSGRLVLYGERRLGKTSTLLRAADLVRADRCPVAVVDLGQVTSVEAAAQRILTAVHEAVGRRWSDVTASLLRRFRSATVTMTASTDPMTGAPTVGFAIAPRLAGERGGQVVADTLQAIEEELRDRQLSIGLVIDEFQRLVQWDADLAWLLKSVLESQRQIAYVLAGSERTVIEQMLHTKRAGLWKLVDVLLMGPIPPAAFTDWLVARAEASGQQWERPVAAAVIDLAGPRTRDVIQLARALWQRTQPRGAATGLHAVEAFDALVDDQEAFHQRNWRMLPSDLHRTLLVLVARDPSVQLTSATILRDYRLGPKSTVSRAWQWLVTHELVTGTAGEAHFDDPFFQRWVERRVYEDFRMRPATVRERAAKYEGRRPASRHPAP